MNRLQRLFTFASVTASLLAGSIVADPAVLAAQDCDNNAIIYCGATTPAQFVSKAQQNQTGDLAAIYSNFGLVPSDYQKFASKARMGTAYKDGRIVVDGKVVATDAWSIGRQKFGYSWNDPIGGKTYYGSFNKDVFKGGSIPVMVLFNDSGVMQFAVLTACGNPITGDKVRPTYGCDLITATPSGTKGNTFTFSSKASAGNGATISRVVYDFGDKTAPVATGAAGNKIMHTYTQPGTYTASVTVYASLPGNQTTTVTSAQCATTVMVAAAPTPAPTTPKTPTAPSTPAAPVTPTKPTTTTPVTTSNAPVQSTAPVVQTASAPMKGAASETATSLPNTGPGDGVAYVIAIMAAAGLSYFAHQLWLRYLRRLAQR